MIQDGVIPCRRVETGKIGDCVMEGTIENSELESSAAGAGTIENSELEGLVC